MRWTRGETLGTGGFGFISIPKPHQESDLPPLIAVKSAKVSESESLPKQKELPEELKACPCILRCFGDDVTTEKGEQLYNLFLEYSCGGSLADRIGKGLPERTVSLYTKSLLTAPVHIHKLGYVHCDVKPQNVLLFGRALGNLVDDSPGERKCTRNPVVEDAKLADFGSCKRCAAREKDDFRGTVLDAAPESITRQEYAPASDIWALGCTVLQMLTGKSPWLFDKQVESKDALFKIGCSDEIPAIPSGKKLSKEAKDFLRKCLVKDPSLRIPPPGGTLKIADGDAGNGHRRHRHHLSSKLSHVIHSFMPHCFHAPKTAAFHACS